MKITVVVPFYFNAIGLYSTLMKSIESYHRNKLSDMELMLVDDHSPLDIDEFAELADMVITKAFNEGYTKTVNQGLWLATGDVLVVANDDLIFTEALFKRIKTINPKELGIWSPKTTDEGAGDKFGSIWVTTRETLNHLGYLDERLRHFFSDSEYYDRAKKMNVPIVKWSDIVIEHQSSATYNTVNKQELYEADNAAYHNL